MVKSQAAKAVKLGAAANPDYNNERGALMAVVIQTLERRCALAACADMSTKHGRHTDCIIFDGGLVRRSASESALPDAVLRSAEAAILKETGVALTVSVKELGSGLLPAGLPKPPPPLRMNPVAKAAVATAAAATSFPMPGLVHHPPPRAAAAAPAPAPAAEGMEVDASRASKRKRRDSDASSASSDSGSSTSDGSSSGSSSSSSSSSGSSDEEEEDEEGDDDEEGGEGDGEAESNAIAPGVSKQRYERMKGEFEADHFYFVPLNTFVEVSANGSMTHYTLVHAKEYFDIKYSFAVGKNFRARVSFLDIWRQDPTRRAIHRIEMVEALTAAHADPMVFYQPVVFAFQRFVPPPVPSGAGAGAAGVVVDEHGIPDCVNGVVRAEVMEAWGRLMDCMAGGDETLKEYNDKYFAHMIQRPLDQPGVALVLTGQKGIGKDSAMDVWRIKVIGEGLSHNYTETRQFFDKYDTDRMNKFFVKIEDADPAVVKAHAKDLRARISAREGTVNPKGKDAITFRNYTRYCFTANSATPIGVNDDNDRERRLLVEAFAPDLKGDYTFFDFVYDEKRGLMSPEAGYFLGMHYAHLDISGYNPRQLPKSSYLDELYELEKTPEERFVTEGWPVGTEWSSKVAFEKYLQFCSDNGFAQWTENPISFGVKLVAYVRDKRLRAREGGKRVKFYLRLKSKEVTEEAMAAAAAGAGAAGGEEDGEEGHQGGAGAGSMATGAGAGAGAGYAGARAMGGSPSRDVVPDINKFLMAGRASSGFQAITTVRK